MSSLKILICGASISGSSLAYFLTHSAAKLPLSITVLERSPEFRTSGQNIDLEGAALECIRAFSGLEQKVRAEATRGRGARLVDCNNQVWAQFSRTPMVQKSQEGEPASGENGIQEAQMDKKVEGEEEETEQIEIPRGAIAQIFYDETRTLPNVTYRFGDHVVAINQVEGEAGARPRAQVTLDSGKQETYDLVIAADGLTSKTRSVAFPLPPKPVPEALNPIKSLGIYATYFSIPHSRELDGNWARIYSASGGRTIFLEPDGKGKTRGSMAIRYGQDTALKEELEAATKIGIAGQKALMKRIFHDAGWESARLIEAVDMTDDFYYSAIAQVKMSKWTNDNQNFTLLGDAGYAPSPFTGEGGTLAITSARVLAGEILLHGPDVPRALQEYERIIRPFSKNSQFIFPGMLTVMCPQYEWQLYGRNLIALMIYRASGNWLVKKVTEYMSREDPTAARKNVVDGIDLSRYA